MEQSYLYKDESYEIIGAALEVHKLIGCGFSEPIYQIAFERELNLRGIPFIREKTYPVTYKDIVIKNFRVDFECYGKIVVELKAVEELEDMYFIQTYNYLKASGHKLALLINFGKPLLEKKRLIRKEQWDATK